MSRASCEDTFRSFLGVERMIQPRPLHVGVGEDYGHARVDRGDPAESNAMDA